jgi:hypothetical protein
MGLFLHLRDTVFRVKDQGVLPVPLDPDLLFIAENAKQSNIIQQLYRTQMERNRSRGPFGDAYDPNQKRDEGGKFTSGEESPEEKELFEHIKKLRTEHERTMQGNRRQNAKAAPRKAQIVKELNEATAKLRALRWKRQGISKDAYDPNQPRDLKTGEWKEEGGGKGGNRAKKGGEIAESNKAFYKGGQFLPSTEAPPGTYKIKGKILGKGREMTEPGYFTGGYGTKSTWETAPTPLHRAIWSLIGQFVQPVGEGREYLDVPYAKREEAKKRGAKFDWDKKKWYMEKEGKRGEIEISPNAKGGDGTRIGRDHPERFGVKGHITTETHHTVGSLIDRFNKGERWIEVKLPPDVQVLMGKGAKTGDAFKEEDHPRGQPNNAGQFAETTGKIGETHGGNTEGRKETGTNTGGAGQGGTRSPSAAQSSAKEAASGRPKLTGLPDEPMLLGDRYYVPGPLGRSHDAAEEYMKSAGLKYEPPRRFVTVDAAEATQVADAFDKMEHDPDNPKVKAAYAALVKETLAQWQVVKKTGLKVQWIKPGEEDPYTESLNLVPMDCRENNHVWEFPTELGYGTDDPTARHNNPMLQPTDEVIDGHKCVVNDIFRIVHDYFGHFKDGVGFTDDGEENAWRSHIAMYSPLARGAMTSETRGQASWVNHGPHGEQNYGAAPGDIIFAPQKIGLMPPWTWEGATRDADWEEHRHPRGEGGKFTSGAGKGVKKAVHFVGFRGEEYNNAVKVYGKPDFIHQHWDERAKTDIAPGDTVVFGPKAREDRVIERPHDDSNQRDDPAYWERLEPKTKDAEWEEHKHPRDEDGKFASGAGATSPSGKTAKASWQEQPPKEEPKASPAPSGEPPLHEDHRLKPYGFEYYGYAELSNQVIFKSSKYAGMLSVEYDSNGGIRKWRYAPTGGGIHTTGEGYQDLKSWLDKLSPAKKPPPKLTDMVNNAGAFKYSHYDENLKSWVFKNEYRNETIEYRSEKPGVSMGGQYWEHRKNDSGVRYNGHGDGSLRRHLERSDRGEIYDSRLAKHYGERLKHRGFELRTETEKAVVYRDVNGDEIFVYKDENDKDNIQGASWRVYLSDPDAASTLAQMEQFNEGKGWLELVSTVGMLKDAHEQKKQGRAKERADVTEYYTTVAADMMKALGYPPARLKISFEPYKFTLNGIPGVAAGSADLQTGEITLYPQHLSRNSIRGVTAHEVMHQKFENVLREYRDEQLEIQKDKRENMIRPSGELTMQYENDFPVYTKIQPIIDQQSDELAQTDGVTGYSREWWRAHKNGEASRDLAIHETLAEMAYLETTDPAKLKEVAKPWRDLYREVTELYRNKDKRADWKYEHRKERWDWQGNKPEPEQLPLPQPTPQAAQPHPAVTQLAHALAQVFNLGDRAFRDFDPAKHPHAPEGAPEGTGGQFVSTEGGGGGGSTESPAPKKYKNEAERLHFEGTKKTALPKSAKGSHPATISTRRPTHVKAEEGDEYRRVDLDAMKLHPENFKHDMDLFRNTEQYPNFRPGELGDTPEKAARAVIEHMKKNLRFLYDNAPEQVVKEGHKWYEGAHRLAEEDATKYGIPVPSAVGVYAALSPQNLWDMNVSQAKRVLDTYFNKQQHKWDTDMDTTGERLWIAKKKPATPQAAKNAAQKEAIFKMIKGKTLAECKNAVQKAMWIRTYDEAHNPQQFDALSPDGRVIGTYLTDKKKPQKNAWHTTGSIANAIISIESGGDRDIISPAMGNQHKVRSFYNNILDPDSDNDDVTMDTHAVGAALLSPMGQSHTAVIHSLGSKPGTAKEAREMNYVAPTGNSLTGMHGTYPLYAEAHRELAKELGLRPRVLQSITWEAKRRLFDRKLTKEASNKVYALWRDYHEGKASLEDTQKKIVEAVGGFKAGQEGENEDGGRSAGTGTAGSRHTGDSRQLYPAQLGQRAARTVDSGGRGSDTRGIASGARLLWRNARLAVFLR